MSDLVNRPTGYVYDQSVIDSQLDAFEAAGVDLSASKLAGAWRADIQREIAYENLRDYEAEYLRRPPAAFVKTGRKKTPGGILEPYNQRTGICNGCSHAAAAWVAWCVRYMRSGVGPVPQEVTLVATYLMGRGNLKGDTGAYPAYAVKGLHDLGTLTVRDLCDSMRLDVAQMTTAKQEDIAILRRDNPGLAFLWTQAMRHLRTRVYAPLTVEAVADCLASGYPVTVGLSWQIDETSPGGNGISGWYDLGGGHETVLDGWFTLNGRLGFLKSESWADYPASHWPNKRVIVTTDEGPFPLYEGQGALWADELWRHDVEAWAIGWPGSR